MAIRVMIADDHSVVRTGIRELLADAPDIDVIAEARDGYEAVDLALAQHPDVVMMDIAMPKLSGVEATRQIRAAAPTVRILVLTAYADAPYLSGLFDAGATSYMLKTAEGREILRAVRATAAGQTVIDSAVVQDTTDHVRGAATDAGLTDRERDVLRLAARGQTNKQIGAALAISNRTVQNHLANIYTKLDVASRTEAVTSALQRGIIPLQE